MTSQAGSASGAGSAMRGGAGGSAMRGGRPPVSIDNRNARDLLHARSLSRWLIAPSSEHAACYLAVTFGLANTKRGDISDVKLSQATKLSRARVNEILADWRDIIAKAGGI